MAGTPDSALRPAALQCLFAEDFRGYDGVARNGGTLSSLPQIGGGIGIFDGVDDSIAYIATSRKIKTIAFDLYVETNSEQIFTLSASHNLSVVAGVLTPVGMTAPTTYVNGTATTAMPTQEWRRVVITTATAFNANAITLALVGGNYGAIRLKRIEMSAAQWTAADVAADYNNSLFSYHNKSSLYLPMHDKISNGGTGFTTSDVSGYGLDATLGDGATPAKFPTKLVGRNGYSFDGATDYLSVDNPDGLNVTDKFSMFAWVSYVAGKANSGIMERTSGGGQYKILFYQANVGIFTIFIRQATGTTFTPFASVPPGTFLLTGTFNKSLSANRLNFYVNSKLMASANAYSEDIASQAGNEFTIGRYLGGLYFSGQVHNAGFSKDVLSPIQIRDLYNQGPNYRGTL